MRLGGAAAIVKVTGIDKGVLDAPDATICTEPLYVPALNPVVETDTVRVEGAVPDAGETLSQESLAVAVHASAPLPLFVSWSVCEPAAEN
jgi:hypothetical protein